LLFMRSRKACAPRAWPRAPGAIPRPSWVGCTPITPRGLVRSRSAAPVADPPCMGLTMSSVIFFVRTQSAGRNRDRPRGSLDGAWPLHLVSGRPSQGT